MKTVHATSLFPGMRLIHLERHGDLRGAFTEVHRRDWETGCEPTQWNVDHSFAGTLRGMHAHRSRTDYITPVWGSMVLGLYDARQASESAGQSVMFSISYLDAAALIVPAGIAHGFYYVEDSAVLIGFSQSWSPDDDVRCHYRAPQLGLDWPEPVAHISSADAAAPGFDAFLQALRK